MVTATKCRISFDGANEKRSHLHSKSVSTAYSDTWADFRSTADSSASSAGVARLVGKNSRWTTRITGSVVRDEEPTSVESMAMTAIQASTGARYGSCLRTADVRR